MTNRKLPNSVDYFYSPKETKLVLAAAKRADKGNPLTEDELTMLVSKLNNKRLSGVIGKINKLRTVKRPVKKAKKVRTVTKINNVAIRVDKVIKRKAPVSGFAYHFPKKGNIVLFPDGSAALEFTTF